MQCPRCGQVYAGTQCPVCGAPATGAHVLASFCGRCGDEAHGDYCLSCGAPIPVLEVTVLTTPSKGGDVRKVASLVWTSIVVLFLGVAVATVAFLLWASVAIVSGILEGGCSVCVVTGIIIIPAPVLIFTLDGLAMLAWYAGVVFTLVFAFATGTLAWGKDLMGVVKSGIARMKADFRTDNPWAIAGQLFAAAWFFDFAYLLILAAAGVQPTEPVGLGLAGNAWYFLFQLINAAVYEELIARVLLIGLPLLVGSALLSIRTGGPILPVRRAILGGGIEVGPMEMVLVVFSSAMFGAAHIFGADLYRFPPTFVGGLALGYLFLRGGLAFSMMFHFVWNSFIGILELVAVDVDSPAAAFAGLVAIVVAVAGLPAILLYARFIVKFLGRPESGAPPPPAPPPPPLASPFWFQCEACGWQQALFDAGVLRCVRCRHVNAALGPELPPPGYG